MPSVRLENLSKSFDGKHMAVCHVDLDIRDGELITLLGPSGCGKTTTLRMIAGLEENDTGTVWIGDRIVSSKEKRIFVQPERRNIGMVFQSYAVWPHMTIFENVAYPLHVRRRPKNEVKSKVREALALLGLEELESRLATQLSGGQQQRVAIARALVFDPQLLLFDEPLSNLDAKLRERMRFELRQLQRRLKTTAIYVTHDQNESMVLSDRIVVMNSGRIEQIGPPREIYERPRSRFVSEFIGVTNSVLGRVREVVLGSSIGSELEPASQYLAIESKDLGEAVYCRADPELEKGDKVILSVRPEHITLSAQRGSRVTNVFYGEVVLAAYVGNQIEYEVKIGGQHLRTLANPSHEFQVGSKVWVDLSAGAIVPLPKTASVQEQDTEL
ncbi:MAG: ABC transporter ATP-binding protein [Chloroflexi bacterium]|nr:ABC transporter ATP-binding protein [Chloroflexota bacterium]